MTPEGAEEITNQRRQEKVQIERRRKRVELYDALWMLAMLLLPVVVMFSLYYFFGNPYQEYPEGTINPSVIFSFIAGMVAFVVIIIAGGVVGTRNTNYIEQLRQDWFAPYGVSALAIVTEQEMESDEGKSFYRLRITWTVPEAPEKLSFWVGTPNNHLHDFNRYPVETEVRVLYDPDDPANYSIRW